MQILPRLRIGQVGFEKVRRTIDTYLEKIVEANNHNAKEREYSRTVLVVDNRVYEIAIPHVGLNITAINAIVLAGTCDILIRHGTNEVVWKTAAGTTLGLSSTMISDTAVSERSIAAGSILQVHASNNAGARRLVLTLRTGS